MNNVILPAFFGKEAAKRYYYDFDLTEMPEMADDVNRVVEYLKNAWWITGNEKRAVMKWESYDHEYMDQPLVPKNFVPIEYLDMDMQPGGQPNNGDDMYDQGTVDGNGDDPGDREPQERGE